MTLSLTFEESIAEILRGVRILTAQLNGLIVKLDNLMNLITELVTLATSSESDLNGREELHVEHNLAEPIENESSDGNDSSQQECSGIEHSLDEYSDSSVSNGRHEESIDLSDYEPFENDFVGISLSSDRQERGIKRSSDELIEIECPNKIPKGNDGNDDDVGSDGRRLLMMNIDENMGKNAILEKLNDWLAQVYNRTTKFYTVKDCSPIGTFTFHVAIDVDLDETKDDIHVVINSDPLHRPDPIFHFIEKCFQERKVVTVLHIVTNDTYTLRETPVQLENIIKKIMEPIVCYL